MKNNANSDFNSKWFDENDNPIWPPNRGFDGKPESMTLQSGTRIDRYGYDSGFYVSPEGTPYAQRSLVPGTQNKPYTIFEVIKPIEVQSGKIMPWFGEKGGGIQYELKKSISELIKDQIIKKVGNK